MILKNGHIVLERVKKAKGIRKILPPLIRLFTGGYYNHAFLVCDGIIDPDYPTVKYRPIEWAKGKQVAVLELIKPLSDEEMSKYKYECERLVGRRYDLLGLLFAQPIYQIFKIFIGTWKANRIICSEAATLPINRVRGYFPRGAQFDPEELRKESMAYYHVVFEGILE